MTGINSINSSTYLEQLLASQTTGSTQDAGTANNAFASLFQSILDGTASAQSTASSATTSTTATAAVQSSAAADMKSLGQALASGNLSTAQLAFQSLQTAMDAAKKAHHHHHHHQDADSAAGTQAATTSTTGSTAVTAVASTTPSDLLNLLMSKS